MGRIDRWDAALTAKQRREAYTNSLRYNYPVMSEWLVKEFALPHVPSETAYYNWKSAMRRDEASDRLRQLVEAKVELADLASVKAAPKDMADALVGLGCEAALSKDLEAAKILVDMAAKIGDDSRRSELLVRNTKAEKELTASREEIAALKKRIAELREGAGKTIVDEAVVAQRLAEKLGLKK